jgi:hypothetical protein
VNCGDYKWHCNYLYLWVVCISGQEIHHKSKPHLQSPTYYVIILTYNLCPGAHSRFSDYNFLHISHLSHADQIPHPSHFTQSDYPSDNLVHSTNYKALHYTRIIYSPSCYFSKYSLTHHVLKRSYSEVSQPYKTDYSSLYEVCSKSSRNEGVEQQCIGHIRCWLTLQPEC